MIKVSVLLPVYNGEKYLRTSIKSVLAQSFTDWELLVLNDGSVDSSLSIINEFCPRDSRIKAVNFGKNIGLIGVLNEGIKLAQGEYIARLDCDDEWSDPDKLKKQVEFLSEQPNCVLVGTQAITVNEKDEMVGRIKSALNDGEIRKKILIKNQFLHSSVLFRKAIAVQCDGYRKDEKYVEDYGLWLRLGKFGQLANLPILAVKYCLNTQGITATKNRLQVWNSFCVVYKYRKQYPNFYVAVVKWILRYLKTFFK